MGVGRTADCRCSVCGRTRSRLGLRLGGLDGGKSSTWQRDRGWKERRETSAGEVYLPALEGRVYIVVVSQRFQTYDAEEGREDSPGARDQVLSIDKASQGSLRREKRPIWTRASSWPRADGRCAQPPSATIARSPARQCSVKLCHASQRLRACSTPFGPARTVQPPFNLTPRIAAFTDRQNDSERLYEVWYTLYMLVVYSKCCVSK